MPSFFYMTSTYPKSSFVICHLSLSNEIQDRFRSFDNIIWLAHQLNAGDIENLSKCENFDVILVSDRDDSLMQRRPDMVLNLQKMTQFLLIKSGSDSTNRYHFFEKKTDSTLVKTSLIHPRKRKRSYTIVHTLNEKYICKHSPQSIRKCEWYPGINLLTYLLYRGKWPQRSTLVSHIPIDYSHTDWTPNNMIVQGDRIKLIDGDDPLYQNIKPDQRIKINLAQRKLKQLILKSAGESFEKTRKRFIQIYGFGHYFDQDEVDE
ncbi:MAG: hypothetical protein K9M07_05100 [Simkaniaceae bacterium]|nr:hypothetical protein [Simkaniaceae bacterium]